MFDYIKGILTSKNSPYCTIEACGIGYSILVNPKILDSLSLDKELKLYVKLIHKEDSMSLCGFINKQERIIFDILTSVSGVGSKVAFSLLGEFEINELINLIIAQDFKAISKTKGIGIKMAQKIVLEIKDKLTKSQNIQNAPTPINPNSKIVSKETLNQVASILDSLGYDKKEYLDTLTLVSSRMQKDDEQELLREVLKILSLF